MSSKKINDLRDAISLVEEMGDLIRIKRPINVELELAGEYLKYAGGTPSPPPTKIGPIVFFENVFRCIGSRKVQYEIPVVVGILGSRERAAYYLDVDKKNLPLKLLEAMRKPLPPKHVNDAPCQEVVVDKDVNLLELLPIPLLSYDSAGPSITAGLVRAIDPDTGLGDVTFHRMIVIGPDTLTILLSNRRHIKEALLKAEAKGKPLQVSVNIGVDPFIALAAGLSSPTATNLDELAVAGALKGSPIEVVSCKTVDCEALANAEIVIEGEIQPNITVMEDVLTKKGWSMPEMAGYMGAAAIASVMKVKAVTYRRKPIYQAIIPPGEEHNVIVGVAGEAEILFAAQRAGFKDLLKNVYLSPAGAGKLLCVLQVSKNDIKDDVEVRNLALTALATRLEARCVIVVDDDVDIFDPMELWWAFTTRFNPKDGLIVIDRTKSWQGLAEHVRDVKMILDCTIPWRLKEKIVRPRFMRN
ncbi:MAG: UbiD family decarboxylase [Candidatus Nezhaarchaeales archaeon]